MDVVLRSDHSANILGTLDDLHFAKLLTVCRHPTQQVTAIFTAILYPTTFPMIQVEPSNLVHHLERRRVGKHQCTEGRGSNRKTISIRKSGSVGSLGITELCSQRKMESNAVASKKPLAGQPCLTPLAVGNCPLVFHANSTCVVLLQ